MTTLNAFLPTLRTLNVHSIVCRVSIPTFKKSLKQFLFIVLVSNFRNFRYFRYFHGQLCHGRPKYGHIRHQQCQINVNQRFVFRFSQILVVMVFPFFRPLFSIEDTNRKRWFAIPYKAMSRLP